MANTVDVFSSVSTQASGGSVAKVASASRTAQESADRFLTLLVAQLQNQDPLSPMDNAQVTSQIAQINTVSGIEKLNTTVENLSGHFMQMQALQGAALVGRDVVVAGNRLDIAGGTGVGGFELAGSADRVDVQVLNGAGQVIDTLKLGAQKAGSGSFSWPAGKYDDASGLSFRVAASAGGLSVASTALMRDRVTAVTTKDNVLVLELQNAGRVAYDNVKALN